MRFNCTICGSLVAGNHAGVREHDDFQVVACLNCGQAYGPAAFGEYSCERAIVLTDLQKSVLKAVGQYSPVSGCKTVDEATAKLRKAHREVIWAGGPQPGGEAGNV